MSENNTKCAAQRVCQWQSEFLSWLVIAITISESTKVYKSTLQNNNNRSGKDLRIKKCFQMLIMLFHVRNVVVFV